MNEQNLLKLISKDPAIALVIGKDGQVMVPTSIQAILQLHREDVQSKVDILFEKGFLHGDKEKDKVTFSYIAFNKFIGKVAAEADKS